MFPLPGRSNIKRKMKKTRDFYWRLWLSNFFPEFYRQKTRMWAENDREIVEDILEKCYIGDWFVLHLLSKNTNLHIYKRIVKCLANVLRERKTSTVESCGGNQRYSMERLEVANGVWTLGVFSLIPNSITTYIQQSQWAKKDGGKKCKKMWMVRVISRIYLLQML